MQLTQWQHGQVGALFCASSDGTVMHSNLLTNYTILGERHFKAIFSAWLLVECTVSSIMVALITV